MLMIIRLEKVVISGVTDCHEKNGEWYLDITINKGQIDNRNNCEPHQNETSPTFTQLVELPVAGHQHGRCIQEIIKHHN